MHEVHRTPAGDRLVSAHSSGPDRIVLTDQSNADAWIASDVTVEPTR